jgi:hypothetical protein
MLRKRMVGNKIQATFPAQALPWSGSTGIISAFKSGHGGPRLKAPRGI